MATTARRSLRSDLKPWTVRLPAQNANAAALSEARTRPIGTWRPAPPSRHESCYGTEGRHNRTLVCYLNFQGGLLFSRGRHGGWRVLAAMCPAIKLAVDLGRLLPCQSQTAGVKGPSRSRSSKFT